MRHDEPPGPYLTQIALVGWENAKLPAGVARISDLSPVEAVEIRWLWDGGPQAVRDLWIEHRDWLLAEGARLGLPRLYSRNGPRYWAEFVAMNLDRKDS